MSQANAAAIRRRANPASIAPNPNQPQQQSSGDQSNVNSPGLTLPQVIALVDRRLINLETFVKESREQPTVQFGEQQLAPTISNDIIDEYNHRFEILADEIANLKDIVLKLQTYTMDVNKMLMDERIHVFSDLGGNRATTPVQHVVENDLTPTTTEINPATSLDLRNLVKAEFLT
jgi:hypothetical protein